jgi:uncharacterized PurR-regulated membrane protein YhhQ (DUF165 family)
MARTLTEKAHRLLLWLAFSVVFALSPLFVNYLLIRERPEFAWTKLYNRGELFLVSAALAADAVARLFSRTGKRNLLAIVCFIGVVFLLLATSVEFGMAAPVLELGTRLGEAQEFDSVFYFCCTVVAGAGALWLED